MIKIDANQLVCINFYYRTQREGVFVRVRLLSFMDHITSKLLL